MGAPWESSPRRVLAATERRIYALAFAASHPAARSLLLHATLPCLRLRLRCVRRRVRPRTMVDWGSPEVIGICLEVTEKLNLYFTGIFTLRRLFPSCCAF